MLLKRVMSGFGRQHIGHLCILVHDYKDLPAHSLVGGLSLVYAGISELASACPSGQ